MEKKLAKPLFIKVQKLENGYDGYNVKVKVVSVERTTSKTGDLEIVRAVVGDDTAVANAFFKGDNAKLIEKGNVIAIRNGRIKFIKNHISLEVDIFGRVTKETDEIKVNPENNISEKEIIKKKNNRPRRDDRKDEGNRRKPRREDDDKPRRDGNKKFENRGPKRNFRDEKKEEGGQRPRTNWTKIGQIEPGDDELNIIAKVVSVEPVGKRARVVLGDQTGIVKGFMFKDECIQKGNTIVIFKAEAAVEKEHIQIQIMKGGSAKESNKKQIKQVDDSFDVSEKAWIQSA